MKGTCIRCGKPFNSVDDIHTCSLPPALALAELLETDGWPDAADELRRLHAENERLRSSANRGGHMAVAWELQQAAEALLRQALDVLENHTAIKHPQQIYYRDAIITAIKEWLNLTKGS
jgi:hypothetical protein